MTDYSPPPEPAASGEPAGGPLPTPVVPGRRMSRAGIIGLVVGALVLVVGVGVFAFAVGGAGGEAAAASAMPADTEIYVSMDLVNMRPVSRLMDAFSDGIEDLADSPENLLDELDRELSAQVGVTLDDIEAWIGRDLGFGVRNLEMDELGLAGEPDLVVSISVDDLAGAEDFMDRVRRRVERDAGVPFRTVAYEGVDIHVAPEVDVLGVAAAYAISEDVLLLAPSVASIEDAIDAQAGESLADQDNFKEMLDALPGSPGMTMYMSGSFFRDMVGVAQQAQPEELVPPELVDALEAFRSMGMSARIIDEGVRFDMAILADQEALEAVADGQLNTLGVGGTPALHEQFPEKTLVYLASGDGLADLWDGFREAVAGTEGLVDMEAFLDEAEAELGLDIERDLIGLLDGEMGFALTRSFDGFITEFFGVDFGVLAAFGTSDAAGLGKAISSVNDLMAEFELTTTRLEIGDGTFYSASQEGQEIVAYGAGGDFAVIGTSGDLVEDFFGDTPRLSDNSLFRKARSALSGETPVMFVDIEGLLNAIDIREVQRALGPLEGAAVAGRSDGDLATASLVLLMDLPE